MAYLKALILNSRAQKAEEMLRQMSVHVFFSFSGAVIPKR